LNIEAGGSKLPQRFESFIPQIVLTTNSDYLSLLGCDAVFGQLDAEVSKDCSDFFRAKQSYSSPTV
jgi:hypothetical protein